MSYHISFVFSIIYSYRHHQSSTIWETIPWNTLINMKRIETYWTMISCWTCRMLRYLYSTMYTRECLISHDEGHIYGLECRYFIVPIFIYEFYISNSIIIGQWSDHIWFCKYSILRVFAIIELSHQNTSIRHPTFLSRERVTGSHHE